MAGGKRPISPHLQIYRPQITSVLSISHRFSGAVLSVGFLLMVYWLAALAAGDEAYRGALAFLGAWPVLVLLFLGTLAFYFHLANGLRHLWWDSGHGFEIPQVKKSGWAVVAAAVVLTLATWAGLLVGGAT